MHITLQQKQGISYSSSKRHKRTAKGQPLYACLFTLDIQAALP